VLAITRLLAFGDSMTAGTTSAPLTFGFTPSAGLPQSYPYKLQELLAARYTSQTIVTHNAGSAGEFVSAGRARLGGVLRDSQPEVLLLMEGANDLNNMQDLSGNALTSAIQRTVDAIEDMVREAQGRGVTPMVATLPPQRADSPKGGGAALLGRYNEGLRGMAAKKGAILVDINAHVSLDLIGQDGLHPTEAGYQQIAEIFREALSARYESPAATR
jgi:lysophospholipase L1-like esterase